MQTPILYSHSYLHDLYHLGILRSDNISTKPVIKAFKKAQKNKIEITHCRIKINGYICNKK